MSQQGNTVQQLHIRPFKRKNSLSTKQKASSTRILRTLILCVYVCACVRWVSIHVYQVSCPLRKKEGNERKRMKRKKGGRDGSMRRRIERTGEDVGRTHKCRTKHTTSVWMKYDFGHLFLLLSLFNPSLPPYLPPSFLQPSLPPSSLATSHYAIYKESICMLGGFTF